MKKYRAIIYDLDGTLVKTEEEYLCTIIGTAMKDLGVEPSVEKIKKFWYESDRGKFITEELKIDPKRFKELLDEYDAPEKRKKATRAYEDVPAVLNYFMKHGCRQGIFTGAPTKIAEAEVELLGKQYFKAVLSSNSDKEIPHKPDPRGLEECLRILGVSCEEALYVGNGKEDIDTARNAKVLDVLIKRGEYEFQDLKPTITIYSLDDIKRYVKKMNKSYKKTEQS